MAKITIDVFCLPKGLLEEFFYLGLVNEDGDYKLLSNSYLWARKFRDGKFGISQG